MRAAWRERYGPPEVVEVRDIPTPSPAQGEVLVRVHAASVNRADLDGLYPRWQFMRLFTGMRQPRIRRLGIDIAGAVEATGIGATRFTLDERVFGDLFSFGQGAFAEYVAVPERALAPMPEGMSYEHAATLPHSAILALQGLRRRDGTTVKAGDRVLIDGASGNVGPFAVQIAKTLGAEVTGVCRTEKVEFVRSLGADHVIDYTEVDYTLGSDRYDWILAVDAHHSLLSSARALKPGGVYVGEGGPAGWMLSGLVVTPAISLATDKWAGLMLWWKPFHTPDVERLKELIAAGTLRPRIDRTFSLEEVVQSLRYVDDGRASGKVVIRVLDGE